MLKRIFLLWIFFSPVAYSAILLHGTRVIYDSGKTETSIRVENVGKAPGLIQSWIDDGDPQKKPGDIKTPFILTPIIAKLSPGKSQTIRISLLDNKTLPKDRESLFWLNVLDIPPTAEENGTGAIQFTIRSRIKLLYRPKELTKAPEEAFKKLSFYYNASSLCIKNNSPYYANVSKVAIFFDDGRNVDKQDGYTIPSFSTKIISLENKSSNPTKANYSVITDYGSYIEVPDVHIAYGKILKEKGDSDVVCSN